MYRHHLFICSVIYWSQAQAQTQKEIFIVLTRGVGVLSYACSVADHQWSLFNWDFLHMINTQHWHIPSDVDIGINSKNKWMDGWMDVHDNKLNEWIDTYTRVLFNKTLSAHMLVQLLNTNYWYFIHTISSQDKDMPSNVNIWITSKGKWMDGWPW